MAVKLPVVIGRGLNANRTTIPVPRPWAYVLPTFYDGPHISLLVGFIFVIAWVKVSNIVWHSGSILS